MKKTSILEKIDLYCFLSEASIRSDMAQRIMYSILPSLSSPTQVAATEGIVDYKSLSYAVEGAKDIIKYGTKACARECRHYKGSWRYVNDIYEQAFVQDNYAKAIKIAIHCFSDTKNWEPLFGGEAWLNIAETLDKIITHYNELQLTDKTSSKAIQLMKNIIIQLNIFDGLSHNTESIMRNLISQEGLDKGESDPEEFLKVRKLMNAKELKDEVDVYSEIEDALQESGDIYKYKDYSSKIRSSPEYLEKKYKQYDSRQRKLYLIDKFKTIQPPLNGCIKAAENLNELINDLKNFNKPLNEYECDRIFDKWANIHSDYTNNFGYIINTIEDISKEMFLSNINFSLDIKKIYNFINPINILGSVIRTKILFTDEKKRQETLIYDVVELLTMAYKKISESIELVTSIVQKLKEE